MSNENHAIAPLPVVVFADFVCPYSYIALDQMDAERVEVVRRHVVQADAAIALASLRCADHVDQDAARPSRHRTHGAERHRADAGLGMKPLEQAFPHLSDPRMLLMRLA